MIRNVGSNWILNVVRVLVLMHLTPFVIHSFGSNVYGVWIAIVALTGLLKLGILGIPMASVRFMTREVAREDCAATNRVYSTCLGTATILGAGALLIGAVVYFTGFDAMLAAEKWASVPLEVKANARVAYWIILVQVVAAFGLRLPYAVFESHSDFVLRNVIMLGELGVRWGVTLVALSLDATLTTLALIQFGLMLGEFVACRIVQARRYPELRFGFGAFDSTLIREILGFSIFTLILNAGTVVAFECDALVIGSFLSTEAVTYYEVGNKFFVPLAEVVMGIGAVVMPTAIALRAKGKEDELEAVFLRWSKVALSIVLWVGIYLWMVGPDFLAWWVEDEYHPSSGEVLRVLAPSFFLFLTARGVAVPLLLGLGHPKQAAFGVLGMGLANLGISLALVGPFGIRGVAIGTAIPNVLFGVYAIGLATRQIHVKPSAFIKYVFGRAVPAALLPAAFIYGWQETLGTQGFWRLFLCGALMSVVFLVTWLGFVFRGDRFGDPLVGIRARLRRRTEGRDAY